MTSIDNMSYFIIYYTVYSWESSSKDVLDIYVGHSYITRLKLFINLFITLPLAFKRLSSECVLQCFCQVCLLSEIIIK